MGLRSWLKKRVLKIDSPCAFSDVLSVNVVNLAPDLQTVERWRYPGMIQRVNEKELEECVEIIRRNLSGACLMSNRLEIWEFCFGKIPSVGAVLEFGVYKAESTNYFASILARRRDARILHGFDSFEGLSNDGHGWLWQKGRFNLKGALPAVKDNVRLHKGWIDDTLPAFLDEHPDEKIAFIHIDTDIYEPAKTILTLCKERLQPGSIILFDELLGYAGWRFHEYKALMETFTETEFEYIVFSDQFQAGIRIL